MYIWMRLVGKLADRQLEIFAVKSHKRNWDDDDDDFTFVTMQIPTCLYYTVYVFIWMRVCVCVFTSRRFDLGNNKFPLRLQFQEILCTVSTIFICCGLAFLFEKKVCVLCVRETLLMAKEILHTMWLANTTAAVWGNGYIILKRQDMPSSCLLRFL